ncbi:RmlC-like cupin domain-containing protein [Xylogone sp. PMI_703]|nr:RmlC-like cupin domain-containing protein [Xylogone sp. PMI_703]
MGAILSKARSKSNFKSKSSTTSPSTATPSTKMSTPAFKHFAGAQTNFKPPLIANENAFLGDVVSSLDPEAPISAGFYRLEKGTPLVYTYTYHEMKIIVDGEFDISDETGQKVHATKGDVFYFPKGSKITFTTDTFGLGFYVGQRKEGTA